MTAGLRPGQALAIFFLAMAAFLVLAPLAAPLGLAGQLVAHVAAITAFPLLATRLAGAPLAPTFGLCWPRPRAVVGAVAIGVSFWLITVVVIAPLALPLARRGEMEALNDTLLAPQLPFAMVLLGTVLAPAIGEELLMRGLLLRAFLPAFGRWRTVAATAFLFGVLHLSLARGLTTAVLGVVLADVAIATGSIVPSMLVHGLNNAMAMLVAAGTLPWLTDAITAQPALAIAVAALLSAGGLALVHSGERVPPTQTLR